MSINKISKSFNSEACPFCSSTHLVQVIDVNEYNNNYTIKAYIQCKHCGSRGPLITDFTSDTEVLQDLVKDCENRAEQKWIRNKLNLEDLKDEAKEVLEKIKPIVMEDISKIVQKGKDLKDDLQKSKIFSDIKDKFKVF